MTKFYTHKKDVPLAPGETLGFLRGKGYFARPAPKPKPAPKSVFSGVGLFTAYDPLSALRFKGLADWVLLQGDPEGGYKEGDVAALAPFFRVMEWQARASTVSIVPFDVCKRGYVGQAEGYNELQACVDLDPNHPRALVGKPDNWMADNSLPTPVGWELIYELYTAENPSLTWATRNYAGNHVSSVVLGIYNGYSMAEALAPIPKGTNVSIWLSETCVDADIEALRAWRT